MRDVRKKLLCRASGAGIPRCTKSSKRWCGTRQEDTSHATSARTSKQLTWLVSCRIQDQEVLEPTLENNDFRLSGIMKLRKGIPNSK